MERTAESAKRVVITQERSTASALDLLHGPLCSLSLHSHNVTHTKVHNHTITQTHTEIDEQPPTNTHTHTQRCTSTHTERHTHTDQTLIIKLKKKLFRFIYM